MNDPKFQYSVFAGDNRNEQYVVRADSITDLSTQIADLRTFLKSGVEKPVPPVAPTTPIATPVQQDEVQGYCKIHNRPLKQRFSKDGKSTWWDHRKQNEQGVWMQCKGKGWEQ